MSEYNNMNFSEGLFIVDRKYDIPPESQKFILQLCWAQHDAQWFLKSKSKFGTEEANALNQQVIFSMGKIEARHVMNSLNIKAYTIRTIPDVFSIINTFMDVIVPKIMDFKLQALSDSEGVGIINKCYVWEEVRKSGGESEYICACNSRHRGWLQAMGVKGKILPVKRISDGDDICEFRFILQERLACF